MDLVDHLRRARNLDLYARPRQKEILRHLAFAYYIRKGIVPGWLVTLQKLTELAPPGFKFNPWHDPTNGEFTSGPSSGVEPVSDATSGAAPKSWGNPKTLEEHFEDHGSDFNAKSPENYAQQANDFYQQVEAGKIPAVRASDGIVRAYDPQTNTFGSYNPDGTTRTFFKPPDGISYFQEQLSKDLPDGQMINPLPDEDAIPELPEIEIPPLIE